MNSADVIPSFRQAFATLQPTPLSDLPRVAQAGQVARVLIKDEGHRPLGNFKFLGGMKAGLEAIDRLRARSPGADVSAVRLICASDGNHGLAVAAAAHRAGGGADVYLPSHAADSRARRIQAAGGRVIRIPGAYDDAVDAARAAAERGEGLLIADTTEDVHDRVVGDVLEGYAVLSDELGEQLAAGPVPTHLFVQAGVGGLAAALAAGAARAWTRPPRLIVVEPLVAACVGPALALGQPVRVPGDLVTCADMLSCGRASAPALEILLRHTAAWVGVDETSLRRAPRRLRNGGGPLTSPSGAAGFAGFLEVAGSPQLRHRHDLTEESVVLLIATERGNRPHRRP